MSALPSPSKSPIPATEQLEPAPARAACVATVPFTIDQIMFCPVESLRQSTSDIESALKSTATLRNATLDLSPESIVTVWVGGVAAATDDVAVSGVEEVTLDTEAPVEFPDVSGS